MEKIKTIQEKVLYIIKSLGLKDLIVAEAIGKTLSAAQQKRTERNRNKFNENDYKNLKNYCIQKLEGIKNLD